MNKVRGIILGFIVWIIYKIISSTWRVKISEPKEMRAELDRSALPWPLSEPRPLLTLGVNVV